MNPKAVELPSGSTMKYLKYVKFTNSNHDVDAILY